MIERINFWGIPAGWHLLGYVVPMVCAAVLVARLAGRVRLWRKVGRAEACWDHPTLRLQRLLKYGFAQVKVLRQPYAGLMHAAIACSFFVFFLGTALATVDADMFRFLRGWIYLVFKLALDLFTGLALLGVVLAMGRRFVQRPERLTLNGAFSLALLLVAFTVLTGLLVESLRLAAVAQTPSLQPGWHTGLGWWTPVGWLTAQLWLAMGVLPNSLHHVHLGMWLLHVGLVGALFATLASGPLLHIITAPLSIFFAPLDQPAGRLAPPVSSNGELVGVGKLTDLTWRQLMQGDACTECGRCQDVCPAYGAGQPLSPKRVVLAIKEAIVAVRGSAPGAVAPLFTGESVRDEVAWACTTCRACVAECPVLIDHVDSIVGMRRYLLAQQRADSQLTSTLGNLRRYGNSFGKSEKQRAKWTTGLDFKIRDIRKESAKVLWFVGDYASYSPALTEVTQAAARVFQHIGLDFALLYDAERNAGNDLRRVGEEGLFELFSQKTRAILEKCAFEEIITTDPHSYNTLKNEYPWNGRPVRVRHYSEVFDLALRDRTLSPKRGLDLTVTYHDPCYLGRYNDVYDAPRRVLRALGCRLVEMPRNRDRALCCGAGGGRIWMEEGPIKERPSESRVREAAALAGVQCLVVACPKDLTMYRDAVKTAGLEGKLEVKDLAELVEAALYEPTLVIQPSSAAKLQSNTARGSRAIEDVSAGA